MTEKRYKILREHLDRLGYRQPVGNDSIPLVEKLLSNLIDATNGLEHYKNVFQEFLQEKSSYENILEPFKQDNARLVFEINEINLKLLQNQEENEKRENDLKKQVTLLISDKSDLQFLLSQHINKIKELEKENRERSKKLLEIQSKDRDTIIKTQGGKKTVSTNPNENRTLFEIDNPLKTSRSWGEQYWETTTQSKDPYIVNMTQMCEKRISCLSRELKQYKEECIHLNDIITTYKTQVTNRDREIDRLREMLKGGRPMSTVNNDYLFSGQIEALHEQIKNLNLENKKMDSKLKESIDKQHEAMSRAVELAEKNEKLMLEMKEMNNVAREIEHDCHDSAKRNVKKTTLLQRKYDLELKKNKNYETQLIELNRNIQELEAEIELYKKEKNQLNKKLDQNTNEKLKLEERIDTLTLIESDLNIHMDKLTQTINLQKRKINEFECNQSIRVSPQFDIRGGGDSLLTSNPNDKYIIEKLKSERDYYNRELQEARELLAKIPTDQETNIKLKRKLNEKDQQIQDLLSDSPPPIRYDCSAHTHKDLVSIKNRLEYELDITRSEKRRIEEDRDVLRDRLKYDSEIHIQERVRFERTIKDLEERLRNIESERRDFIQKESTLTANIRTLEEKLRTAHDQILTSSNELGQQKQIYSQIKHLHEKSDRSLIDQQTQMNQLQSDLFTAQARVSELERDRTILDRDVNELRTQNNQLRATVVQIDQEKDALLLGMDNKTEQVAHIEKELKSREQLMKTTEAELNKSKKKFDLSVQQSAEREQLARSMERELEGLRHEVEQLHRAREAALRDNVRLQDDLDAVTHDLRMQQQELAQAKSESDAIKRQLKDYVTEVRRVEDTLSQKEQERSQMLDHFRSLTLEATVLENNNHSLESEAEDSKKQLKESLDRTSELEHQLQEQEALSRNYQSQLADLTSEVISLKKQLNLINEQQIRSQKDSRILRDLTDKLENQKGLYSSQASNVELSKIKLENELSRLQGEQEIVNEQLTNSESKITSLENMLKDTRDEAYNLRRELTELTVQLQEENQTNAELKNRLRMEENEVRQYQTQAAEYSKQLSTLRRDITNQRFDQARASEKWCYCTLKSERVNEINILPNNGNESGQFNSTSSFKDKLINNYCTRDTCKKLKFPLMSSTPVCQYHNKNINFNKFVEQGPDYNNNRSSFGSNNKCICICRDSNRDPSKISADTTTRLLRSASSQVLNQHSEADNFLPKNSQLTPRSKISIYKTASVKPPKPLNYYK